MAQLNCLCPASEGAAKAGGEEGTEQFDDALPEAVGEDQAGAAMSGAT